eukprot:366398-Chlamydomonas_euryale.AAC.2
MSADVDARATTSSMPGPCGSPLKNACMPDDMPLLASGSSGAAGDSSSLATSASISLRYSPSTLSRRPSHTTTCQRSRVPSYCTPLYAACTASCTSEALSARAPGLWPDARPPARSPLPPPPSPPPAPRTPCAVEAPPPPPPPPPPPVMWMPRLSRSPDDRESGHMWGLMSDASASPPGVPLPCPMRWYIAMRWGDAAAIMSMM